MAALTEIQRKIKNLAAFLGLIQGLAWIMMGAICVILHMQDGPYTLQQYDSYMGIVQLYIYSLFLNVSFGLTFSEQFLVPEAFNVCMWIEIVVNSFWVLASFNALCNRKKVSQSLKLWSVVTWIVCIYDFIMMVLLGSDYHKCLSFASQSFDRVSVEAFCANGILPVLMIAAKGFVLWILNVTLSIVLFKMQANVRVAPAYVFPRVTTSHVQSQPNIQQPNPPHHNYPSTPSSTYFTPNSPNQGPANGYSPVSIPSPTNTFSGYSNSFATPNRDNYRQEVWEQERENLAYHLRAHQANFFPPRR